MKKNINRDGYPPVTKEGSYYWVYHGLSIQEWELCQWDGYCFKGYGLENFERKINFPIEYQEIKKPK
ncbi:hypothetical protein [Faecalibacter sp. LW9]|uniref:hypothetical protein n=1 Tax=Faecalibacter sp. LW9 TaxID=3103144 RepID=UPI002AFE4399|nr:hypothetical protein [Faecalibacter sp. LW9]